MPDPFSLGVCAIKMVAAAASLLAAADKGVSAESAANAIEALMKGGEAVGDFRDQGSHDFANALKGAAKSLEARYEELLRGAHSAEYRESVAVAFANLSEVIAQCLPARAALARMNHDPETIARAVVDAAIQRRMDIFADPSGEARQILIVLVSQTYTALRDDPKFMDALQGVNWAENFARLDGIEGKIDRSESEAERRHRESTAAIEALRLEMAHEKGVPPDVLRPLFDHLGMAGLSVLQMRERAEEAIAAILAKASEKRRAFQSRGRHRCDHRRRAGETGAPRHGGRGNNSRRPDRRRGRGVPAPAGSAAGGKGCGAAALLQPRRRQAHLAAVARSRSRSGLAMDRLRRHLPDHRLAGRGAESAAAASGKTRFPADRRRSGAREFAEALKSFAACMPRLARTDAASTGSAILPGSATLRRGAEILSAALRSPSGWRGRTRAIRTGSAIFRFPTTRSATFWCARGICPRR